MALVAFGGIGALALEIDVIHEAVEAAARLGQCEEPCTDGVAFAGGRGREDFGQGCGAALCGEFGLKGNGGGEQGAEFLELRRVFGGEEGGAV